MPTRVDPTALPLPVEYDWDELFDGSTWKLKPGVDFHCNPSSMVRLCRKRASDRGLVARASVRPGGVVLVRVE